jgi:hypothetical protein
MASLITWGTVMMSNNRKPRASNDEKRVIKADEERARAIEALPHVVAEANCLLSGFGSSLQASVSGNGTITLRVGRRVVFSESPSVQVFAQGTVAQPAGARMEKLVRNYVQTVDCRLREVIEQHLPKDQRSRGRDDAPRIARLLMGVFWPLADSPIAQAAVAARKLSPKLRINGTRMAGAAAIANRSAGARYGAQAIEGAPVIAAVIGEEDTRDVGQRVGRGDSVIGIAEELGIGPNAMKLTGWTLSEVHANNIAAIEQGLADIVSHGGTLPSKSRHSRQLVSDITAMANARADDDFRIWYLKGRAERIQQEIMTEAVKPAQFAAWAELSRHQRGGWRVGMEFDMAVAMCVSQSVPTVSDECPTPNVRFNQQFGPYQDGKLLVAPVASSHEMWNVGQRLRLCLANTAHHPYYTAAIKAERKIVVAVYLVRRDSKTPVSCAELNPQTLALVQHSGVSNNKPSLTCVKALDIAVGEEVKARVAAGVM